MKSTKFLEDLSKLTGKTSDRQLGEHLGISHAAINHYRSGRRIMDNETCLAVALALGIDPSKVIMAADMDRAEKTGQHSLWEVFIQRTAQATSAALGIMVVAMALNAATPNAANAHAIEGSEGTLSANIHVAPHAIVRRLKKTVHRSFCFWRYQTVRQAGAANGAA